MGERKIETKRVKKKGSLENTTKPAASDPAQKVVAVAKFTRERENKSGPYKEEKYNTTPKRRIRGSVEQK